MRRPSLRFLSLAGLSLAILVAHAQTMAVSPRAEISAPGVLPAGAGMANAAAKPVVATGAVPDEATKAAILGRLRELYGADRVVDQIVVDAVIAPPNWSRHVVNMLGPGLQQVSAGQLAVNGNSVRVSGQVGNEAQRQQVASDLSTALNKTYSVTNALRVGGSQQAVLDTALADRIIEFQSGSATLTAQGIAVLDEMAAAMTRIGNARVQVIGHTDSVGARQSNVALSMARATAVKAYLEQSGIPGGSLAVQGLGPDQPVADNTTPEGRARNRRIQFKVL